MRPGPQRGHQLRDAEFRDVHRLQINQRFKAEIGLRTRWGIANDFVGDAQLLDGILHVHRFDLREYRRFFEQDRLGQTDVSFARCGLLEDVPHGGLGALRGIARDAELEREVVCGAEADAPNIRAKAIRIRANERDGVLAVGLVDAHGPRGPDAVRHQECHNLAGAGGFAPTVADHLDSLRADPFHLAEVRRRTVDHFEGFLAEHGHDFLCIARADSFNEAGAEVLGDAGGSVRRRRFEFGRLELLPVRTIRNPTSLGFDVFPRDGLRHIADDGDEVAVPARLDAKHAVAAVQIVEGDAFDRAAHRFGHSSRCGLGFAMILFEGNRSLANVHERSGRTIRLLACFGRLCLVYRHDPNAIAFPWWL